VTDARFATTPTSSYYAVVFTSQLTADSGGYGEMADRMVELAQHQPGYLGIESTRDASGFGITVSYWESEAAIVAWRANAEHRIARETGRARWYQHFELRVAKVERSYRLR
jgi:heme-degrading monooxygenase HmoA